MTSKLDKFVNRLYRPPPKDNRVNMPKRTSDVPFFNQQADILYLPNDKGFKYALVVADIHTGLIDATPLRHKSTVAVANAFEKIYDNHKILKLPKIISLDRGSEFKNKVKRYFNDKNIIVKYADVGRHRQLANVEAMNGELARYIFRRQLKKEIEKRK